MKSISLINISFSYAGAAALFNNLSAVLGSSNQPDLLILDEPTNNLDIKSTEILENALGQYRGAILLVSHDAEFVNSIGLDFTQLALRGV